MASLNEQFFEDWNLDVAYVLGYIYADATVQRLKLGLGCRSSDESVILSIREKLGSQHKVRRTRDCTFVDITRKALVDSLQGVFGDLRRKSFRNIDFPVLPKGEFNHFVRGYMDGDGSVSFRFDRKGYLAVKLRVYGSYSFMVGLRDEICREAGVTKKAVYRRKEAQGVFSEVDWAAKEDLFKLYGWLYPAGKYIFMQRKRDLFKEIMKQINQENPSLPVNNKTGFLGISKNGRRNITSWGASVTLKRKKRYLGSFSSLQEAAFAYNIGAKLLQGDGAKQNRFTEELSVRCKQVIREKVSKKLEKEAQHA